MKPIHVLLLIMALIAFFLAYITYDKRKKAVSKKAKKKDPKQQAMATGSTTVIVDPTDGQEYVISPLGENSLDESVGTTNMRSNIANVIRDIDQRTGTRPKTFELRIYNQNDQLMGSSKINNPFHPGLISGTPATQTDAQVGGRNLYACQAGQILHGPDYYKTTGGEQLFGMFCSESKM